MILYHGTSLKNAKKIIESGYIGTEYFDVEGVYLDHKFNSAMSFGNWVFEIDSQDLDTSKISMDDVNDGFLYKDRIPISICTIRTANCQRTVLDTMFLLIEEKFDELKEPKDLIK